MAGMVSKQGGKKVAGKNMNTFAPSKKKGANVVSNKPGKTGK